MSNTIEQLTDFVNQNSGIDKSDYPDSKSYNDMVKEITKTRNEYYELLSLFLMRYGDKANERLTFNLETTNGQLRLANGQLEFKTDVDFAIEYRKSACHILAQLIWNSFSNDRESNSPNPLYKTFDEMREAIAKRMSKRVMKLYFN